MSGEHMALLELMPEEGLATNIAEQDGAWNSPETWGSTGVPGFGAIVWIPEQRSVTYSVTHPEGLFLVRVDGALLISSQEGSKSRMTVDTLFATPGSSLTIESSAADDGQIEVVFKPFDIEGFRRAGAPGWSTAAKQYYSDGAPVQWTKAATVPSAKAQVLDDGPGVLGRFRWDPKQLSIGLIVHGRGRIEGQAKRSKSPVFPNAELGDTEIQLMEAPDGWRVGDRIVITGTHYVGRNLITGAYAGSQDELRVIQAIDGKRIQFDQELEFDHSTPRSDLRAYAANLTRNIQFRSQDQSDLLNLNAQDVGAKASNYGHVMFMHSDDVQVRFASFDALGRTNKNLIADDYRRTAWGLDWPRQTAPGGTSSDYLKTKENQVRNPRGRYAVHFHRTGARYGNRTALAEGVVATGGPGWGIVSHDSSVDFIDNITYGVLGAGFVAETGNETGNWTGNIAINTYGTDYNTTDLDPTGLYQFENDDFERIVIFEKRSAWRNHDFGHFGEGFWFQGKIIKSRRNVSVNSGLEGYFFMFRAPDQINVHREVLDEPLSVHSPNGVHPMAPGLHVFEDNESIADRGGLIIIGIGGGRTNDERSVIRNFTAWEVGEDGTHAQYYPGYTIRDSTFLASKSHDANPHRGVLLEKVQLDTVLANLTVEGFPRQYELHKSWSPGARMQQGLRDPYEVIEEARLAGKENPLPIGYGHILIDPGFTRAEASSDDHLGRTFRPEDIVMSSKDLKLGRLDIELDDESLRVDLDNIRIKYGYLPPDPIRPTLQAGHVLLLRGTKTDSIGSVPIAYHNNVLVWHKDAVDERLQTQGYFHMPNGALGVMLEEVFSDRYTAEMKVVRFVAELDARWDLTTAVDLGAYKSDDFPDVYVPAFLMSSN